MSTDCSGRDQRGVTHDAMYCVTKLIEILFVRELVKHTGSNPVITLVNPGLCHSDFQRNIVSSVASRVGGLLKTLLARTTEVGSRTLVAGICAGPESHGEYMSDCRNQDVAPLIYKAAGEKVQLSVYDQTLSVLEKIQPGISDNI